MSYLVLGSTISLCLLLYWGCVRWSCCELSWRRWCFDDARACLRGFTGMYGVGHFSTNWLYGTSSGGSRVLIMHCHTLYCYHFYSLCVAPYRSLQNLCPRRSVLSLLLHRSLYGDVPCIEYECIVLCIEYECIVLCIELYTCIEHECIVRCIIISCITTGLKSITMYWIWMYCFLYWNLYMYWIWMYCFLYGNQQCIKINTSFNTDNLKQYINQYICIEFNTKSGEFNTFVLNSIHPDY